MMACPDKLPIPSASILASKDHVVPGPGPLLVTELTFQVPLTYAPKATPGLPKHITLFARRARKHDVYSSPGSEDQKPYLVYLEGGPGFGNREPQDHPVTRHAIHKGYQVLLLDHRGTGLSTPVGADMLDMIGDTDAKFEYLKLMRQDNTVRDCEAVRQCLTKDWPEAKAKWSIFGQSYGGFVGMSYLSMHPEGLKEVFLTGGLAPVSRTADEVYAAVFPRVAKRNEQYYKKFPEDVANLRQLAAYIESKGAVPLPSGGHLTVPRLLTIGIAFGGHGGFDQVHSTILHLKASLDQLGFFTRASLAPVESFTPFDTNIIYAILHEAIYCDGPGYASNWASQRVGEQIPDFPWIKPSATTGLERPLYFSGENIFPFHFDTHPELIKLREVAQKLATYDQWPRLYDLKQLGSNNVPVYAASYVDDMYVDNNFARETASLVGAKTFETNVMYHNALRTKSDEVLSQLFALKEDVMD